MRALLPETRSHLQGMAIQRSMTDSNDVSACDQKRRILALFLSVLAVSLLVWTCGYRLSLYHAHKSTPHRTVSVKVWIEPKNRAQFGNSTAAQLLSLGQSVTAPDDLSHDRVLVQGWIGPTLSPAKPFILLASCRSLRSPPSAESL